MYTISDEYGAWEVEQTDTYISRRNISPTQKYIDENPTDFSLITQSQADSQNVEQITFYQMLKNLIFGGK